MSLLLGIPGLIARFPSVAVRTTKAKIARRFGSFVLPIHYDVLY
jgi:hypothetical protein